MKRSAPKLQPIGGDMILPNHSGDNSAGSILSTPVNPNDMVNKNYVDNHRIFGEIFVKDNAAATILNSVGGIVQVAVFDTDGISNGAVTPDHTNDHITAGKDGKYRVTCSISVQNAAGASNIIDVSIFKNNGTTKFLNCHAHRTLSAGTDIGSITMQGMIDLLANDTIELWADTSRAVDTNVIFSDITLNIEQMSE